MKYVVEKNLRLNQKIDFIIISVKVSYETYLLSPIFVNFDYETVDILEVQEWLDPINKVQANFVTEPSNKMYYYWIRRFS